ncbi:crotonobetaine/carnitine-CoA ligase [Stella humosa]|uniref:Crotonobetaine/carnitine-CoA ligase n=1 Tax=Stella humosa TaxID=94 RepID=A0A3N1KZI9_9PROT|nr:AMP-binding protein [Stella humosa]ROP83738.1 crotonobetaine/carnitine-CoA ligase [Stella humosa]BBK33000.1 ATP-dependent acyl-CoA ligase [Stella humosa]
MAATDISGWVLGRVLARQAERYGDRDYLRPVDGPPVGFAAMDRAATRIANGLIAAGVGRGDPVLAMLPNSADFIALWCGVARAGAVFVPINTAFKGAFLEHIANVTGARAMVAAAIHVPTIAASAARLPHLKHLWVHGGDEDDVGVPAGIARHDFAELAAGSDRGVDVAVAVGDVGAILFTSGTSGPSKGPLLPHGHLHLNGHVYADVLRMSADDVLYTCLPLFHANALLLGAYGALMLGAPLVLAPRFSASGWLGDIRRHGVTVTNLLGTMMSFLMKQPPTPQDRDHGLRAVAAVPLVPALAAPFQARFGAKPVELYGTTEINCPFYMPLEAPLRPGSCGRLIADWFEVRVADPATDDPVPVGQVGELLVRPTRAGIFLQGYCGMPEATVAAFRNLWFHTGDAFKATEDGWYSFVDRMRDCIRRRGENVSSWEIEQALIQQEDVLEAAVVGVPSDIGDGEEEIMACLVPRPGHAIDPKAIWSYCDARLPRFAVPRFVRTLETLPRTATEKVRKEVLRGEGIGAAVDRVAPPPSAAQLP